MPLVYCNSGERDYSKKPISINTRGYWEFQCTISGKNRMTKLRPEELSGKEEDNFWISTPDSTHGWTSDDQDSTRIAVFHFTDIPDSLENIFKGRTTISTNLDTETLDIIWRMAEEMMPQVYSPNHTSGLQFEICCRQLCLIYLRNSAIHVENLSRGHHEQTIRASIAWYCANMHEGIGIQETAEKMGYSVSQLRKIFTKVRGTGPKKVFEECRMNRARELIQHGTMSIIDISLECGYNNQSSFSRAFREFNGMSPLQFKRLCQKTRHPLTLAQIRDMSENHKNT